MSNSKNKTASKSKPAAAKPEVKQQIAPETVLNETLAKEQLQEDAANAEALRLQAAIDASKSEVKTPSEDEGTAIGSSAVATTPIDEPPMAAASPLSAVPVVKFLSDYAGLVRSKAAAVECNAALYQLGLALEFSFRAEYKDSKGRAIPTKELVLAIFEMFDDAKDVFSTENTFMYLDIPGAPTRKRETVLCMLYMFTNFSQEATRHARASGFDWASVERSLGTDSAAPVVAAMRKICNV